MALENGKGFFFIVQYINLWPKYVIYLRFFNGFSLAWYPTLRTHNWIYLYLPRSLETRNSDSELGNLFI